MIDQHTWEEKEEELREIIAEQKDHIAALEVDKARLVEALEGIEILRRDVINAIYRCKDIARPVLNAARKETR